jgi:hypothetical protein
MTIHLFRADWSNEELTELSRFCALIAPSHSPITMELGVGEAGDPWAVLCNRDGDVLLHVARIAGKFYCVGEVSAGAGPNKTMSDALGRAHHCLARRSHPI